MIMDEKCENERTADVLVIKVNKSEYVIKVTIFAVPQINVTHTILQISI